jgi:hypothetical protein
MENQESPWGREEGRGSSRPFSSTFKKRSDQKGKLFEIHEDFAVISPHNMFFGPSIFQNQLSISEKPLIYRLILENIYCLWIFIETMQWMWINGNGNETVDIIPCDRDRAWVFAMNEICFRKI